MKKSYESTLLNTQVKYEPIHLCIAVYEQNTACIFHCLEQCCLAMFKFNGSLAIVMLPENTNV